MFIINLHQDRHTLRIWEAESIAISPVSISVQVVSKNLNILILNVFSSNIVVISLFQFYINIMLQRGNTFIYIYSFTDLRSLLWILVWRKIYSALHDEYEFKFFYLNFTSINFYFAQNQIYSCLKYKYWSNLNHFQSFYLFFIFYLLISKYVYNYHNISLKILWL